MNILRRLARAIRDWWEHRYDPYPEGCCECGTGGPYYRGRKTPVVRYIYSGACRGTPPGEVDWVSCSEHPISSLKPIIDYGTDMPKTIGEVRADVAALLAEKN